MERNTLIITGSFKGIAGTFIKRLSILIIILILYIILSTIKNKYYVEYNVENFFGFIGTFENVDIISILSLIFIFYLVLFYMFLRELYKTIILFYEVPKKVTIDYENMKIISTSYSFPFNKQVDENKFNDIINVAVSQDLSKKIFNSGDLYLEFLVYSKLDSQLRYMDIPCVADPYKIKKALL